MIEVAIAIEHDAVDPASDCSFGNLLTYILRCFHVQLALLVKLCGRNRNDCMSFRIVDDLGIDRFVALIYRKPGTLRRSLELLADAHLEPIPSACFGLDV